MTLQMLMAKWDLLSTHLAQPLILPGTTSVLYLAQ